MFRDFAGGPQQRHSSGLVAHCLSFVSFRTPILCESSNKKTCFILPSKVIIEKSRGKVSLLEQDTIENVSESIKKSKHIFKIIIHFLIHQNLPQIMSFHLRYMMVS